MILESINLKDIDFDKLYYNPGCALSVYKPESEHKILELLQKYYNADIKMHNVCCHHEPGLPKGATIINNCAGCDRRFRNLYEGIKTITLWEILDTINDFPLPDYEGKEISVHDSCSYRPKPQVHEAVRNILRQMNFKIIDSKYSGTKSICCGDNFYKHVPNEEVIEFQKKRAAQMPCDDVAVYCVSCVKSMHVGGKKPLHMVDLVLGESTQIQTYELDLWHEQIDLYIEAH